MKNKIIIGIIIFLGILLMYNTRSEATFEISNFQINCNVEDDGDIEIEENITYYTDESKNGLIREIKPRNNMNSINSADSVMIESVEVDGQKYRKTSMANIGDNGVYTYKKDKDTNQIKVFSPFKSTFKTVTYKYKLTDVAVRYNDTAELYWNFIGEEWDCKINTLNINITLPELAKDGTIYVYGHGSDNGSFSKTENFITLNAKEIKAFQAIDARILFSTSAISNSTKIVNKNVLDKYINEEEGMTEEREKPKIIMGISINEIAFAISIIILIVGIIIYVKYDKEYKVEKYKYYREIPCNLEPEILQRIYYGKNVKSSFWITFLNLIKKGVFRIEKTTNEVGKETENIIFEKDVQDLKSYQTTVKNIIKSFILNKENSIDFLELQAKMKRATDGKLYGQFEKKLEGEMEGLFGELSKIPKKIIIMFAIGMAALILLITILAFIVSPENEIGLAIAMVMGFTTVVYSMFFSACGNIVIAMIFLIVHCSIFQGLNIAILNEAGIGIMYLPYVLLFILIQYVVRVKKKSKEERQIREQIKGLRRYIKDCSLLSEKEEITQIKLWEDYFILAIALGLNNRVINNWYEYGANLDDSNLQVSVYNGGGYLHISRSMMPTFITYSNHSSYSSHGSGGSGSSGGFSGSSGGFSGGSSSGGGGRRRWRRKFFLKKCTEQFRTMKPLFD